MSHELEDLPPDNAAPLWAEVRAILAGTDIGSLPNDYPLSRMAEKRMAERDKFMWQVRDTCARAEAAEKQCVLLTKQRELLEAALLKIAYEGHKVTWARAVARNALDASFLLGRREKAA